MSAGRVWLDRIVDDTPELTAAGRERRAAMLGELQLALGRRRLVRQVRAVLLLVLLVGGGLLVAGGTPAPGRVPAEPRELALQNAVLQVVSDDASILESTKVATRPIAEDRLLDDESLLDLLESLGRPAGLVRVGRRVRLTDAGDDD